MKDNDLKTRLMQSLQHLLSPLVRLLLKHGISFAEFEEIARLSYVAAAEHHFKLPNRKMSDSRIAVLTGLTRKEVKRLREIISTGEVSHKADNAHRATRVLGGWHRDPDFCGKDGYPQVLPMEGEFSFAALVRRYSGDIPSKAMLEELARVAAVRIDKQTGTVTALTRVYMPVNANDPASVRILGTATHDLISTIEHNMSTGDDDPRRLQRSVSNGAIPARLIPIFQRVAAEQSQTLLESLDDWLTAHEEASNSDFSSLGDDGERVGVGVYFFRR